MLDAVNLEQAISDIYDAGMKYEVLIWPLKEQHIKKLFPDHSQDEN